MKICHFNLNQAGVIVEDKVYPIGEALVKAEIVRSGYTMLEVIDALANLSSATRCVEEILKTGSAIPLSSVKLLAPIYNPGSLWAAAGNYRDHQAEMMVKMGAADRSLRTKDELMADFFLKPSSSIIGPGGTIIIPKISKDVDFECELCAVIGKKARYLTEERALDCVFGYMLCWDISQRDPWGRGVQNTRNIRKGFDTFTGLGPWIVTKDEIEDPQNLRINVEQNGKSVMSAHTRDMICGLRDHIRFLTSIVTLRPGDLITTGTPAGVRKLSDGDHLSATIDNIGQMELYVEAEK